MRIWKVQAIAAMLVLVWLQAAMAGPTYDKVMQEKVVRAGIMTDSIPGAFYNDKKEWVGMDVDIAEEIAKRIGAKLERVPVTNKTRIAFVQQGRIDMSIANMTHKRERDKSIDFSITYFFDGQKILAPKGKYKELKDFVGKKIATMQGTTSEINVKNLLKELGDPNWATNVISYQKESECFQALRMGRVAGWSTDSTILLGYAAQTPESLSWWVISSATSLTASACLKTIRPGVIWSTSPFRTYGKTAPTKKSITNGTVPTPPTTSL